MYQADLSINSYSCLPSLFLGEMKGVVLSSIAFECARAYIWARVFLGEMQRVAFSSVAFAGVSMSICVWECMCVCVCARARVCASVCTPRW